jgi:CubicO group peptidase (beta-lactamase class C family)
LLLAGFVSHGAAVAATFAEVAPEEVGLSSARLERLTKVIEDATVSELPGVVALIARRGKIAYFKAFGMQDKAMGRPMARDSIFRLYSMTKPIVSVAVMQLVEEGKLALYEPISKYLPEFTEMKVGIETFDQTTGNKTFSTIPAKRQITVQDLLRHTSGLTYGALGGKSTVKEMYRDAGISLDGWTTEAFVKKLASLPLQYEPGTVWEYGHSTDVLGRLVEVVSRQRLDAYLAEHIFKPLEMVDTAFHVPPEKLHRLAQPQPDRKTGVVPELLDVTRPTSFHAGGHGLVGTIEDYLRFCQMILNGGELDGVRVLSRKTVEFLGSDHLPPSISRAGTYLPGAGYGFGLGFAVRTDPGLSEWPGSVGELFWGGYGGTAFWIDRQEQFIPMLFFQDPTRRLHYRMLFRGLALQSIVD